MDLSEQPINGGIARLLLDFLRMREISDGPLEIQLNRYIASGYMTHTQWWSALDAIRALLPGPRTTFEIGLSISPEHLGVLGHLLLTSSTLGELLQRFQRYLPLIHQSDGIVLSARGSDLGIHWTTAYGSSHQVSDEVYLTAIVQLLRLATGRTDMSFSQLQLDYARPGHAEVYEQVFACPVAFDQEQVGFWLPLSHMQMPLRHADSGLANVLERQAAALMVALPQPGDLVAGLRRQILSSLQDGEANAAHIAARLGISRTTLHRHLSDVGLTYAKALRSVRELLSRQYLDRPELSLSEISLLLGYSEQSTFTRAFKAWNGLSPQQYRLRLAGNIIGGATAGRSVGARQRMTM